MPKLAVLYHQATNHILGSVMRQDESKWEPTAKELVGSGPRDGISIKFGKAPESTIPAANLKVHVFDTRDLTSQQIAAALVAPAVSTVETDTSGKVTGMKVIASPEPIVTQASGTFTVKVNGIVNTRPTYALVQRPNTAEPEEPDTSDPGHFDVQGYASGDLVLVLVKEHLPKFT